MIINREIAARLEATDALHTAQYAHQRLALYGVATAVETVGDGLAVYCGSNMPTNRVVGLGLTAPVTREHMDELEDFYVEQGSPIMVDFCPLADDSLLNELRKRRYYPHKMYTVLAYPLDEEIESPVGIETHVADEENLWVRTVSQAFEGIDDVPMGNANNMYSRIAYYHADGGNFIAFMNGEPAGAGASYINKAAGVVELYSGATRVQYRRRGVQQALVKARLENAKQMGCDLGMVMTTPGSASERNLQRLGFRVAYTKLVFTRDIK